MRRFCARHILASAVLITLLLVTFSAIALPQDNPILYPALEMDPAAVAAPTDAPAPAQDTSALEMDDRAMDEHAVVAPKPGQEVVVQPDIGGGKGENRVVVSAAGSVTFDTPLSEGVVDFTNPEGSTVNVQYLIEISVAELQRQLGRTGYTAEEYARLSAEESFDPEQSYVVLGQTKGIAPGKRVHAITLGTLPDGSTLGVGSYDVQMVMSAFDVQTNQRSMVGIKVQSTIRVLSDETALTVSAGQGSARLFSSVSAQSELRYYLVIAKEALPAAAAAACRDDYYQLADLGTAKPGEFLETDFTLAALPDGSQLPAGRYEAWILRYRPSQAQGQWENAKTPTKVSLSVE